MDVLIKPSELSGNIRAISSKSDVQRALIAAALAKGKTKVHFTTLSDDIKATVSVLSAMGAEIDLLYANDEYVATVCGIEKMGENITLNANECGTCARIILPVAAALSYSFTLTGKNGLLKRPFKDLCDCMAQNGTNCSADLLPITTSGRLKGGRYEICGDVSSQYISGLLFALPLLDGDSEIVLKTPLSSVGYVSMTIKTLSIFGIEVNRTNNGFFVKGGQKYKAQSDYIAEGDWSNAAFWLCGGAIGSKDGISVSGLSMASPQLDSIIFNVLHNMKARIEKDESGIITVKKSPMHGIKVHGDSFPDILPIIATTLCIAEEGGSITGGERLRIKESDRIATTTAMLKALGADIKSTDGGFEIYGVDRFIGGEVDSANDHRIAMCAAVASGRCVGDIIIHGAECVNKSYPTFFEDFEKLGGKYSVIHG